MKPFQLSETPRAQLSPGPDVAAARGHSARLPASRPVTLIPKLIKGRRYEQYPRRDIPAAISASAGSEGMCSKESVE